MKFQELGQNGRVWIYPSSRKLLSQESAEIHSKVEQFLSQWAAHGSSLKAKFQIFHSQFLVLAVDDGFTEASGCSIDKATALFQKLDQDYQLDLFNRFNLFFKADEDILLFSPQSIKQAYDQSTISKDSLFFNNALYNLSDFRSSWLIPFSESWAFKQAVQ